LKPEDFDAMKKEAREYAQEIASLKGKIKEMFRENNRLRERVAELEGKGGGQVERESSWQKLLKKKE